jgi:hypothetical protein
MVIDAMISAETAIGVTISAEISVITKTARTVTGQVS